MAEKKVKNKSSDSMKISMCSCKHVEQDKIYGYNMRAMNQAPIKGGNMDRYKCTVCSTYYTIR
jgi:hypothetical protein